MLVRIWFAWVGICVVCTVLYFLVQIYQYVRSKIVKEPERETGNHWIDLAR
jgi:hypothetical protein